MNDGDCAATIMTKVNRNVPKVTIPITKFAGLAALFIEGHIVTTTFPISWRPTPSRMAAGIA